VSADSESDDSVLSLLDGANGKAERFIQTVLREWAYAFAYPTSQRRAA
jgi:hypothetical protein